MEERALIEKTKTIITESSLIDFFKSIGISTDDDLCVHSSMSSIGYISGGPQTVITALLKTITQGTVLMPAHSGDWSDPAQWEHPPVPATWFETLYQEMPAFDPKITPIRKMGKVAEQFFALRDTLRSNHPQTSFCARGIRAHDYTKDHALTPMFGLNSPLGKLYQNNGKVLLFGVGFDRCTLLHVAEHLTGCLPKTKNGAPMMKDGHREWIWFEDDAIDSDDFPQIGAHLVEMGIAKVHPLGYGEVIVMSAQPAVDAAVKLIKQLRYGQ